MRQIKFVAKLISEEKIKLVEPSKEVSDSYSDKSRNSLRAANILLEQNLLEEAMSMAYYAMYHKATSLFYLIGIKCENHAATIILLKELFGVDNSDISFAKNERFDKQYYTDFVIGNNDVDDLVTKAESFIATMDSFIDKITVEEKKKYLAEFRRVYFKRDSGSAEESSPSLRQKG
ncbi:MAG: HEPN domain-containing protein [Candidatus Woesearchaeota archaeon]